MWLYRYCKSIYIRKYHILNVLSNIQRDTGIQITCQNRIKVLQIFVLVNKVIHVVNSNRKKMTGMNYIIFRVFKLMKIEIDVSIPRSKKTLQVYKEWWDNLYERIKDDMNEIILK